MPIEVFLALAYFAAVSTVTPGPNNLLLLASGVNFGFRRSLRHIFGINIGFPLMIGVIGLGVGKVIEAFPPFYLVLKVAGGAYLLWHAWKIATAGPVEGGESSGKPLSFFQAAAFQWVNPKGWIMALSAIGAYTVADNYYVSLAIVVAAFFVVGWPSSALWVSFGSALRRFMSDPRYYRPLNIAMALLLVASLVPMLA